MPKPVRIIPGDCRRALRLMAAQGIQVDSVVTDPPYHLTSIVKRFGANGAAPAKVGETGAYARASRGFMGKQWDGGDIAFTPETWEAVYRVMKPGAHLLAFAGTRGYHRMICAIEDAGFEIRDCAAWLYGSGFPKSHNQGGEWEGWGTALKPAWEPITVARKPLDGTVASNLAKHGVGALNIDGCRIEATDAPEGRSRNGGGIVGNSTSYELPDSQSYMPAGRWPANVLHDGSEEVVDQFPAEGGAAAPVHKRNSDKFRNAYGAFAGNVDEDGSTFQGDSGTAARFFYSAKADAEDRLGSRHPTVKPVDLMRYLCRLVTPPGGLVLDPFAGSGTTGMACLAEGFRAILCEREPEYIADIKRRLAHVSGADTPLFASPQQQDMAI